MRCWGELKSLGSQSVGEVSTYLVMRAIFGICGSESKAGLQLAETLATPL